MVWCYLRWRAKLAPQARRLMTEMRELLDGLIAQGSPGSPRFADVGRRQGQALEDLIDRVNDRKLRRYCREALDAWRDVWSAGPSEGAVSLAVEVWRAMTAQQAISVVCKRINTLERLLPPRDEPP